MSDDGNEVKFATSLCRSCRFLREVTSGKGSVFLLCERSKIDPRFAKYPPQPIARCSGYEADQASR